MTFLLSSLIVNSALFTLGFLVFMPIFVTAVIMIKAKKERKRKEKQS